MQSVSTWREILGRIIEDPDERHHIAREIGVNQITMLRWVTRATNPRLDTLTRLIPAIPSNYQQQFFQSILREFPDLPTNTLVLFPLFRIRIIEEPLTAQNLATIISALTELSTKYWLIAKGRFADLIEYTQTHNGRFAEEANTVITRITYNSPMNMDWKVDLSVPRAC